MGQCTGCRAGPGTAAERRPGPPGPEVRYPGWANLLHGGATRFDSRDGVHL